MNHVIDVSTGEVKVGRSEAVLASNGIGSCIAIVALDMEHRVGGIAHVMLAGKAPAKEKIKTKYAADAINCLLRKMRANGAARAGLKVFIAGGGNVLKLKDDTVCAANIKSAGELLRKKGILIVKRSVGGTQRRTVRLDIGGSSVHYSLGNGPEELLWSAEQKIDRRTGNEREQHGKE